MKKIFFWIIIAVLVSGCANKPYTDELAPYRHLTAHQLYQDAEVSMAKEDYGQAVKQLSALDALYPFGAFSKQAQLNTIYAYYMNNDKVSAVVAALRFIHLYPQDSHVDYAYYMRGVINFSQGLTWLQRMWGTNPSSRELTQWKQAFVNFNQLVRQFPHTRYRNDALLRMIYIRNLLAEHEITVAKYYFEREAYVAAANRAAEIILHFPKTPVVKAAESLIRQVEAKLGLKIC